MTFKDKNAQKGFTLLEAMITMVIVSVGLLAMSNLLVTAIKVNQNNEIRMNAASVAQSVLSSIVLTARDPAISLSSTQAITIAQNLLGAKYKADGIGGFNPTVVLAPSPTASGMYSAIVLTLEWSDRGSMKNVQVNAGVY
ncbi:MAG: prepilin-type N-terminal cleavage/methylation domain-containing protein, partial [Ghiorsea sp.]